MFNKILIANRGEIACRVAATCKRLGIASVAVYSDADANAKHVAACDEAVHIGGSTAAESYLRFERIIDAALRNRRAGGASGLRLSCRKTKISRRPAKRRALSSSDRRSKRSPRWVRKRPPRR